MFDFYRVMYQLGYLSKEDVHEAATWGVITTEEYKQITGEDYVA
jgi:uncharacterized XkdX family phage protein